MQIQHVLDTGGVEGVARERCHREGDILNALGAALRGDDDFIYAGLPVVTCCAALGVAIRNAGNADERPYYRRKQTFFAVHYFSSG